jgi:hypothetical protein
LSARDHSARGPASFGLAGKSQGLLEAAVALHSFAPRLGVDALSLLLPPPAQCVSEQRTDSRTGLYHQCGGERAREAGNEALEQFILERDQAFETAGIALPRTASEQLAIDARGFVKLG